MPQPEQRARLRASMKEALSRPRAARARPPPHTRPLLEPPPPLGSADAVPPVARREEFRQPAAEADAAACPPLSLLPEIWCLPLQFLRLAERVRARAACRALADAGGAGMHPPLSMSLGSRPSCASALSSPLGRAFFGRLQELRICLEDSGPAHLAGAELVFPALPALEVLRVRHYGLAVIELSSCPQLRCFEFDWAICSSSLKRFRLVAGPLLTAMSPRPDLAFAALELFALEAPGLAGVLDLSELECGTQAMELHCASTSLQVVWPSRSTLRRLRRLSVHVAHSASTDSGVSTAASGPMACTGLNYLSVVTGAATVELPEALHLQEMELEAPHVRSVDLSDWASYSELRSLRLRNCQSLAALQVPFCGELSTVAVDAGPALEDLRLFFRRVLGLSLQAPQLRKLHVTAMEGLDEDHLDGLFGGCPQLEDVALANCRDLEVLRLGGTDAAAPRSADGAFGEGAALQRQPLLSLLRLNLGSLSRVHRLRALELAAPRLAGLVLPPCSCAGATEGPTLGTLRRVVLHCPALGALDLSTVSWSQLDHLELRAAALASLRPPAGPPPPAPSRPGNRGPRVAGGLRVVVASESLGLLDLRGAQRLAELDVHLTTRGASILCPLRRDAGVAGSLAAAACVALPRSRAAPLPASPLDADLRAVSLAGCCQLPPGSLAGMVARWPRLRELDLSGCGQLQDADLLAVAAACGELEVLSCRRCPLLSWQAVHGLRQSLGGLRKLDVDESALQPRPVEEEPAPIGQLPPPPCAACAAVPASGCSPPGGGTADLDAEIGCCAVLRVLLRRIARTSTC